MADQTFHLADMSETLLFDIFDKTTNRDHYPVRFQRLSTRLQDYALDLQCYILDANAYRQDTPAHKSMRYELQTKAITTCNKLIGMPVSEKHRITLPEWGRIYDDLSGAIKDYDIRNGDAVFITDKRYVCGY